MNYSKKVVYLGINSVQEEEVLIYKDFQYPGVQEEEVLIYKDFQYPGVQEVVKVKKDSDSESKYAVGVPEECVFYRRVKNQAEFNRVFVALRKNFLYQITKFRIPHQDHEDVLNYFACWMLAPDCFGKPRYQKYNPEVYPDVPFFKWLFIQMRYLILKYITKSSKVFNHEVCVSAPLVEKCKIYNCAKNEVPSSEGTVFESCDVVESVVYVEVFKDFLRKLRDTLLNDSFAHNALEVLESRERGELNLELAARLGVSPALVSTWAKRLYVLASKFIDGEEHEYMNV